MKESSNKFLLNFLVCLLVYTSDNLIVVCTQIWLEYVDLNKIATQMLEYMDINSMYS